jgi:8-oxo-dGTP diphosphatase
MVFPLISVVAGVLVVGETVFIARRNPGGAAGGMWEFPGGKVETAELPRFALVRELKEELNLEVVVGGRICTAETVVSQRTISLDCYWINEFSGELQLSSHTEYAWANLEHLGGYEFASPDLPVIREMRRCGLPRDAKK